MHHPPTKKDGGKQGGDSRGYTKVQSEQSHEFVLREKQQLSLHGRNPSTSALLTPHLLPNSYDFDERSLARTEEESSVYHDEENPRAEGEEFGL